MPRSRRHHYIPRFWIKRWCNEKGLAIQYTQEGLGGIAELRRPPKSIGYWYDLYSAPPKMEAQLDLEESFFKRLDDHSAKVFSKLNQNGHLTGQEASTLAVFLLSLMHRTPSAFKSVRSVSAAMLEKIRQDLRPRYSELRGANDPPTVEEYEALEGPFSDEVHFYRNLPNFIVNKKLVTFIASLHWHILKRPAGVPPLLLSDDPLIRTNGLKKADGHLAFPLSPNHLIFGAYKRDFANFVLNSSWKEIFGKANIQAVESARHFVVSQTDSQARFIRNRFGRNLRPSLGEQIQRNQVDSDDLADEHDTSAV